MLTLTHSPTFDFTALHRANISPTTRTKYIASIKRLVESGINPFNYEELASYANTLPHSSKAFLKSALRVMAREYRHMLQSGATVENLPRIEVMLHKLDAMNNAIQVRASQGEKAHIWLSNEQITQITALPDRSTIQGRRDWIILAVLFGAGLRREELADLTFDCLIRQPMKNGQTRGVLAITGKGSKKRVVPISPMLEQRLREWHNEIGDDCVVRAVNKAGKVNGSLSPTHIYKITGRYGAMIGLPGLQPHDCRRTYAQSGINAGIPIQQISKLLGHSNIAITQRYLNLELNIEETISDHIPLSGD